jgi:hypothetical protein
VNRSCPWCLEPLPGSEQPPACPHCGRPLGEAGELEARALRFARTVTAQGEAYRRLLAWGAAAVAALALLAPLLHLVAVVLVPLVLATHLAAVRLLLVRDAQRLLRPMRRLLNRWLLRFAFLWIGLPGYGAMMVPVAGVAFGAGTFALLTSVAHVSTRAVLERERASRPLAWWERALPASLAVLTVAVLLLLAGLAVLFGWSVAAIVERLQGS